MNTITKESILDTSFIGSEDIQVGNTYKHYKGMTYKIVMKAWASDNDKLVPMIVYQGQYTDPTLGKNPIFAQTEDRFLTTVTINGKTIQRFTLTD